VLAISRKVNVMTAIDYLAKLQVKTKTVNIPSLGDVHLRGLNMIEYGRFEDASETDKETNAFKANNAMLIRLGVVDETGKHVFDDSHLPALANLPAVEGRRIARVIYELSGVLAPSDKVEGK
jgi:hypothetical protein